MTQEQIDALKKSIEHWEKNCHAKDIDEIDTAMLSCELCNKFYHHEHEKPDRCEGCPIFESTGLTLCRDTPYYDVDDAIERNDFEAAIQNACHEFEFLKSLLPKEK